MLYWQGKKPHPIGKLLFLVLSIKVCRQAGFFYSESSWMRAVNCCPISIDWPAVVFFVQSPDLYKKESLKWMGCYSANCSSRKWKWDFALYRKLWRGREREEERERKRQGIDRGLTVLRSISKSLKLLFYPSLCTLEWTLTLQSCILWYWSSS